MSLPLVSCIMPTTPERGEFVAKSIEYFRRQTYDNRQLVIAGEHLHNSSSRGNPGADKAAHPPITWLRSPAGLTLGAKRNWIINQTGGFIAHWDDDDWYGPTRLADQVALMQSHKYEVCGNDAPLFCDLRKGQFYRYHFANGCPYGATLMYTREFWQRRPFADTQIGETDPFMQGRWPVGSDGRDWYVGMIHDGNTVPKALKTRYYAPCGDVYSQALGADWPFYQSLREKMGAAA
jgi:hypothetical protein